MPAEGVDIATGATEHNEGVFEGVHFAIIPSADLSSETADEVWRRRSDNRSRHSTDFKQLKDALINNGATECALSSSELRSVTHLISTTSDFPAFHDAVDGYIHVVKPSWVTTSVEKKRAANPRQFSPDPSLFLTDVVVLCAEDIPTGDKDAILGGVLAMGGLYSPSMSRLVTHVVALSMNNPSCRLVQERSLKCKPVLPHWFDDCLKLGKRISYEPYLLPDPPILHKSRDMPMVCASQDIDGASTAIPDFPEMLTPPTSPSKQRRELDVFKGNIIFLADDLHLSTHLKRSITDLILNGGGKVVKRMENAHTLICHYRDGPQYDQASRAGLIVGNIAWLYYLIRFNRWTSPTRRLLHYPLPREGVEGFNDFTISVSNYTGEARVYLENLVKAAGGKFTKSMAQENTHLITAHTFSEKCDAAREWGINLVNHLWLEDSYAKCKLQSVTNPKYTTFPAKTNLSEVVGQTQIDRDAVERYFFPELPSTTTPASSLRVEGSTEKRKSGGTPKSRTSSTKTAQTPAARLGIDLNETPGSRGAKDRALKKLHQMAPDIALFQKESKRVGGVIYGGRKASDSDRMPAIGVPTARKRSITQEEENDTGTEEDADADPIVPPKRQKKAAAPKKTVSTQPTPGPLLHALVTGYLPWKDNAKRAADEAVLRDLSIEFLDSAPSGPSQPAIDIIVAPKILRTQKFLSGIAFGPMAANTKWLDDMVKQKKRLPPENYELKDTESEKKFDFVLEQTLQRAKEHTKKGGMLRDWLIFCTENVPGGWTAFRDVISANGGTCLLYRGRETNISRMKSRARRDARHVSGESVNKAAVGDPENPDTEGDADVDAERGLIYLVSATEDKAVWSKFRKMTTGEDYVPRIVSTEWIRRIACTQDVGEWDADWEFT